MTDSPAGGSRGAGVALLIAASVLWSLGGVFVKSVDISPVLFAFWRALAAGIVIAPLVGFSNAPLPQPKWMLLSILFYTPVVSLVICAMTYSTAATGILLQYTGPAFCALLAWLVQGRRISSRTWLAIGIALLGVTIMVVGGGLQQNWVGPVCGLLSGVAFGALLLTLEKLDRLAGGKANPFAIVTLNNLGCTLLLLPIVYALVGRIHDQPWKLAAVAACGVVQLGIPYVLFQLGLRRVSAVDAALLVLLEPVLNPILVAAINHEVPDAYTFIGGAAILVALMLEATSPSVR